jgi:endonuclease YncB( thermonuclease family)
MRYILIIFCLLNFSPAIAMEEIVAQVIAVQDGNTLTIQASDGETYEVLLFGIDSPELGQAHGKDAKLFLEKMVLKKKVTVKFHGKDRTGKRLAVILLKNEEDPRVELLKEGLAWTVEKNAPQELEPYIRWARAKKKGLWEEETPTPPWQFRREQSMTAPKSR